MAPGRRVIFLGTTGIDKHGIAERLAVWCDRNLGHRFRVVDFERDYLTNRDKGFRPLSWFLANQVSEQHERWTRAWSLLEQDGLVDESPENRILLVHGCVVRGNYGVRCVCNLEKLRQFGADTIINLIDDVYNLWWRTEARAHGEYNRGRPTLEQLLMARRTEQMLGDVLALQSQPHARHLVLASGHPIRTLAHYVCARSRAVYLSFPITRPREMLEGENDTRGVDAVNDFLRRAYAFQRAQTHVVLLDPLTIDELPLLEALVRARKADDAIAFPLDWRWDLAPIVAGEETLSPGAPPCEQRIRFNRMQLENAVGLIRTDVSWRDFRLVSQSDALAVLNPVMARDRLSRGVMAEIEAAITERKTVYVYQDPAFDPTGIFLEWVGQPGTMSADERQQWVVPVDSLDEMFRRLENL